MTRAVVLSVGGSEEGEVELPPVFGTPLRRDVIHKAYVNLASHAFQPQGTHPTAGMDVVARSNDPPTGRGVSRIAKMRGGGGGRAGQAGGVASVRGGRQAHPPSVYKSIRKKINRKENRLALCSAIAATASRDLVESRGHRVDPGVRLPLVVSSDIERVARTKDLVAAISALGLAGDLGRLAGRKARTGKSSLRGRPRKVGKSVLFVTGGGGSPLASAAAAIPGVDVRPARRLSVLDLAPGSTIARLTAYSRAAVEELAGATAPRLELMAVVGR